MNSHTYITTPDVDVTVDAINTPDSRVKASKLLIGFTAGTTVGFTINDRHLREIVNGLDEYLKSRNI